MVPDVDSFHIALIRQALQVVLAFPPGAQGAVVGDPLGIHKGLVEMEAEVLVIALVQLVAFPPVGLGHDAPSSGQASGLFQQECKIRPLFLHRAVRIGFRIRPLAQAAPHDQVEVEAVQLPPLPDIGLRQALPGARIFVRAFPQGLHPALHKLFHQTAELLLAEVPLAVRDLPPEGEAVPLHVA